MVGISSSQASNSVIIIVLIKRSEYLVHHCSYMNSKLSLCALFMFQNNKCMFKKNYLLQQFWIYDIG